MRRALETGEGYGGTVEFFPEEGKYHLDGHRTCGVRLEPAETRAAGGLCPSCGKPLTVGVMHRVEELADRSGDTRPDRRTAPFRCLVPLPEILGEILGAGSKSLGVERIVSRLIGKLGPEIGILETVPVEDVSRAGEPLLAEALDRLRAGRVLRESGYDGEYGVIRLFEPDEIRNRSVVAPLFGPAFGEVVGLRPSPPAPLPAARPDPRERGEPGRATVLPFVAAFPGSAGVPPAQEAETDGADAERDRPPSPGGPGVRPGERRRVRAEGRRRLGEAGRRRPLHRNGGEGRGEGGRDQTPTSKPPSKPRTAPSSSSPGRGRERPARSSTASPI